MNINNKMNYKEIMLKSYKWRLENESSDKIRYNKETYNKFLSIDGPKR